MRLSRRALLAGSAIPLTTAWRKGTGTSFPTVLLTSAQKIIDAANNYVAPSTLGSAPSMTVSGAFATSSIAGVSNAADNPSIVLNDARIATTGPVRMVSPGNVGQGFVGAFSTASTGTLWSGGDGWGARFVTNSRFIEFSSLFDNTGTGANVRLRLAGAWAQTSDYTLFTTADFNPHYALFDLGSATSRLVEVFFGKDAAPAGFNVSVGATFTLPTATPTLPTASFFGDSYVGGNTAGLLNIRNTLAQAFGQIMGVVDIVPEGVGGQGYITTVGGLTIAARMASDPSLIPAPDVVYAMGSLNDRLQDPTALQTAISTGLSSLKTAYPNAWIVFFTGFTAVSAPVSAPNFTAAFQAATAVADNRMLIIDTSGYPVVNTSGTLPNSQAHDSADGVHPGPNEIAYMSAQMKTATVAAIRARTGL